MATPVTSPRGMRDFLPVDKARRERALSVIRRSFAAHGFDEIETPVMEDAARLHSGLGGDNEKLGFAVLKRGLSPETVVAAADNVLALTDLGLRFDLTVPLARFYASHRSELPTVFRSIQIAPVWRAERPQKGRFRQFMQCDIDIIGEAGQLAEIELITATAAALSELGLTGCSIRINDRRILTGLLAHWGVAPEAGERALITLDKLDKIGVAGVVAELDALAIVGSAVSANEMTATLTELGNGGWALGGEPGSFAPDWLNAAAFADLQSLRAALPGVDLVFDPTLVRGMGYYTGTIFEISHPDLGYSLGGGGRYDGMIGRFLGTDVPACGFSIGFERIVDLLGDDAASVDNAVVLVHDTATDPARLVALKTTLVARGLRVRLERRSKNLKALLERAAAGGYGRFALVGPDTLDADALDFKPLGATPATPATPQA
ncbi:MAG: histidine--tRNA ligase [Cryobacterium sp.]